MHGIHLYKGDQYFAENLFSITSVGKTGLHIRIPAGFPGPGRGNLRGEHNRDAKAFGGL
jgi:hypothetical protein